MIHIAKYIGFSILILIVTAALILSFWLFFWCVFTTLDLNQYQVSAVICTLLLINGIIIIAKGKI